MNDKFNIPMPTEDEKDAAVRRIVAAGIKHSGLLSQLTEIYRALGLRCIFWDTADCFAIAIISFVCAVASLSVCYTDNAIAVLFAVSPVFYVVLTIAVQWKEHMTGLYELKMTCKYTIQKVTAFRMSCFLAAGLPTCGVLAAVFEATMYNGDFIRLLLISVCSMFLCAVIMMLAIIVVKRPELYLSVPVVWGILCLTPAIIFGKAWNDFLLNLSYTAVIIAILICAVIYTVQIKKLILNNDMEDTIYADC